MTDGDAMCIATEEGREVFDGLWEQFKDNTARSEIKDLVEPLDIEYLEQGDTRVALLDHSGVFIHQPHACVVKVEKHGTTIANEHEWENYNKVQEEVKKHLLPITDHSEDFKWLVTPYIQGEPTPREIFEMEKILLEAGWNVGDVREGNVMMVQDKPVLVDYDNKFQELDTNVMSIQERIELKKWKHGLE